MEEKEVFTKVAESIAEALDVEIDEITPEANLMDDLGAESIDFLDIIFRIENTFNIKIPRGGMQKEITAADGLKEEDLIVSGTLTALGIENLKKYMPEVDPAKITEGFKADDIPTLFTCQTFVNMVKKILDEPGSN
ncbi:MAG: phosphopantetheine-binding protein [Candidatus Anammoxibacter sp.]